MRTSLRACIILLSSWRCPLKYDIAVLAFSPTQPSLCYVAGLDNELLCGVYAQKHKGVKHENGSNGVGVGDAASSYSMLQQNHRFGFRGDSRWVGMDFAATVSANADDVAVGICESGSAYTVRPAQRMVGSIIKHVSSL